MKQYSLYSTENSTGYGISRIYSVFTISYFRELYFDEPLIVILQTKKGCTTDANVNYSSSEEDTTFVTYKSTRSVGFLVFFLYFFGFVKYSSKI
jgi:hypothetical protein